MADLFNNSNPVDYDTQTANKPSLYQNQLNTVRNEEQIRLENRKKYGVELSDEEYSQINDLIAHAENPDEESHKIASAILVSQNTNIPLAESYQNLDSYIQGLWGDGEKTSSYKNAFVAISDMFAMGANNIKIGVLGNKIIQAEKDGDEEALQLYMKEYKAYMDDNATRQDNAPRTWATKVLECGAQSAPYTGAVSGAALFGSLLGPAGSVGASVLTSTALMRGEIYMDLRAKGIEPEIARKASLVSALPQATIEAFLGEAAAWAGAGLKALGKGASKTVSSKVAEGLANTMQAKFHFGPGSKLAVRALSEYLGNLTEEGAEEYLQEGVGAIVENEAIKAQTKVNQAKRAEILDTASNELGEQFTKDFEAELLKQYPDLETQSFGEIHKNMIESFKGGVMGAIALGIVPTTVNSVCTAADYNLIKEAAENIPSKEMFKKVVKESEGAKKVFEQFGDEKAQNDAISQVWENAQSTRDKRDAELIAGTKETTAFSENMEEAPKENDEGETEVIPAARDDKGRLYTEKESETETEDGKKKGSFKVGNAEAGDKNLYGYINYTLDEKNNTVTIDDFKMTAYRRGLTQEFFDEFAQEFAGVNINWNPLTKAGKDLKSLLVSKNFTGKNNGLNYYTQENLIEAETRRSLNKQLIKYMPNLNHDQRSAAIALLEAGARRQGYSLSDYVSNTFGNQIIKGIGDTHNVEQIFRKFIDTTFNNEKESNNELTFEKFLKDKYNKNSLNEFTEDEIKQIVSQNVKGYSTMPDFQRQVKAVIYAGEHADFSTFAHELAHVWQSQLTGDLKAEAEAAFNVKKGDWNNSYYTFADGHTESAAEAFARGFEDYLRNGKAPNAEMKNLFQKFAEFLQDVYRSLKNFINMSPEIENVYNQLMSADDSVLALAEKAVQQGDREYIAELKANKKAQAEAEEKAKAEAKENAEQAAKEKADEESEITLSDENISEPDLSPIEETTEEETAAKVEEKDNVVRTEEEANKTLEELLNFFDEKTQEETEDQTLNAYKDETLEALEGMSFAESEAKEVIKTVTNKDETLAVKVETTTDTAGKARDNEFYIFQLAGREGIKNLVSAQERARRIESYYEALRLAENENNTARRIKLLTGWEKNASGKWVYETDDSIATVNSKLAEIINEGRADALSDKQIPSFALSAIYKNDELYEMYPIAKDFTVQFFTDKLGVNAFIKADGIAVNTTGLTDSNVLKRRLIHEIQHIIQAVENYAEGNDDISGAGIHGKDFNELWQSLKEAQTSDSKMYDASALELNMDKYLNNEAEIDARNVARRALMSANERRASLLSDTTDVKSLPMLFQLIGEKGATNLDLAEEVTTRRDNLAIAREMEKAGKDAKAIRLATGWEKGKDGLWRYEIDDLFNAVSSDFLPEFNPSTLTDEENARLEQLGKKLADYYVHNKEALTDAELEEYSKLRDEANFFARYYYDFENNKYKTPVPLEHVFNAPELYKAYPDLRHVQFIIDDNFDLHSAHGGMYERSKDRITLSHGVLNKSSLLHEIQHAIQAREGFARGGNIKEFETQSYVKFLNIASNARDFARKVIEADEALQQTKEYKALENVEYYDEKYDELDEAMKQTEEYKKVTELAKEFNSKYPYFRTHELINNYKDHTQQIYENHAKDYGLTPTQMYKSLAGEVESRNVEARRNFTPEERLNTLLSETADVAPEDQIVMFEGAVSESILFQTVDLTQDFAGVDSGSITEQMIENHLNSLIGQTYDTATKPLQIQLTKENNPHVKKSNVKLEKGKKKRHFAALNKIEQIINNASMIGKPTDVDLNHNTNKKTIKHKNNVLKYIYFESPIKINNDYYTVYLDTERVKNQDPALLDLYNIRVKKNVLTGTNLIASPQGQVNNSGILPNLSTIYLQTVYHGSGANFERFNTDMYGFSGEGSMSFGYGTYLTDSEEIAREYAERQRKRTLNKESVNPYDRGTLEYEMFEDLRSDGFNFSKTLYKKYLQKEAENIKNDPDNPYQDFKANEKLVVIDSLVLGEEDNKTNLYTVEIPDDGYFTWSENLSKESLQHIKEALTERGITDQERIDNLIGYAEQWKDNPNAHYVFGSNIYKVLTDYLGGQKQASQFLNSIGYAGIKYPAGTIHGNGNGAYNYVIFDDEEAKIVDHLLFQTQEELMKEAASFDNWEEFMEWEESHGALEEVTPIPKEADAAWYKATWELAKGITHEEQENKTTDESMTQQTIDALFMVHMEQSGVLENFLKEVNYINDLDFETMGNAVDAEEQAERDRQAQLKDYIAHKLRHGSWISNATRVANGKELTPATRKRLLNLIRLASREYRDVYTQITGDQEYAVPKNESYFESHIANNAKKLNKLLTPEEALAMSPEQLRALADSLSDEISNKEISQKIKNGTLKMDDELKNYIVRLDRRVKDAEERYDQLKKETEEDFNRLNSNAQRKLLNTYEELLRARAKLNNKKNLLDKKIAKGIKLTERYQKDVYKAQATYDDVFITWSNLTAVNKISAEVQEAMKRKEEYIAAVEEQAKLKNDKAILTQISDMRKKLVKSAMRRVPFERINYEQAKTIIAIQRIFYPNLKFDVNKWIGERPIYLKGIAAEYLTNAEKRAEIDKTLNYKRTHAQSDGAKNRIEALQELLKNLKTSDDVDKWTTKEKNLLMRYIPQKDWAKELNLEALEKERADSIQLDIDEEGYTETKLVKLPNGKEEIMVYTRPKFSEEIGQMVKDALGADLYNQLVNKPFEDWTTNEMEKFTKRIDEIYREGRDELEAKRQAKKDEAKEIRNRISEVVHNTGIEINDTDTPEEKEEKLAAINKILGNDEIVKGTFASKKNKQSGKLGKLLHGFADANVRRFARILDNYTEGVNSTELFFKENECYIAEQEMLRKRQAKINAVLKENDIKIDDLYKTVIVNGNEYSYDDLLYVLAADKDYETKDNDKGVNDALETDPMADNDDYAPTARNAVMFGNLGSRNSDLLMKESNKELDEQTKERHANNEFTEEEQKALDTGYSIISTPGTKSFIADCHRDYAILLNAAKNMLKENPKFERLIEAIDADYTEQFERTQEVCVEEFNAPINRVKKYVPLNRMESNGDTNENRVKEDLLATSGASTGKNFVDKGMTQKRISISPLNQKPVEMGLYKTWADATARTEHFIAYAGYVRELNRVYKGRDAQYVRRYIENRYGHGALEYIDNYIAEVANPNATAATGSLDQIVRALRGKTAPAYLAWKVSGIIKQAATSPWPYMQFVKPHEYLKANLDILTSKGSLYDVIKEKSVYMNNRVFDPVIDLINEQIEKATNPLESKLNKFNMVGMQGLEMIDWVCVAPGWLACYRKKYAELESINNIETVEAQVKAENEMLDPSDPDRMTSDQIKAEAESRLMSEDDIEKEAVLYADDCTRLCQPSNRKVDLAPLFKASGPGSEIGKAFLQFQTSLNVIWENIRYDIPYAMRQKKYKQIAGMILGYVMAGITVGAITEGFKSDEDDEEKKRLAALRKFIYYGTTQFTDAIPVIGGIVSGMDNKIIAGNKGLTSSSTDLLPMVTKVKTGTENMFKGNWEKALWNYGEAAGLATGLPVSGAKELFRVAGIGDFDGELDFKPESFIGRRD